MPVSMVISAKSSSLTALPESFSAMAAQFASFSIQVGTGLSRYSCSSLPISCLYSIPNAPAVTATCLLTSMNPGTLMAMPSSGARWPLTMCASAW